jgi:hypothetical protein
MDRLGWRARIGLREGVGMAYEDFRGALAMPPSTARV